MKIKPISKFLKIFLGKNIAGITLCPFGIYVKDLNNVRLINHEKIHWKQQLEMLVIFFYIWYIIEFLIRKFISKKDAYMNLAFEREAYNNDDDLNYLENRKHFSWIKYIKGI